MRTIKFRAWDKTCGEFTNIEYLDIRFKNNGEIEIFEGDHIVSTNKTNDYELNQYTGLKDKNGKEVFEGDIVRNTLIKPQLLECYCANKIIGSAGYAFKFRKLPNDEGTMWRWETTDIEVIGNIYENKELLKEL